MRPTSLLGVLRMFLTRTPRGRAIAGGGAGLFLLGSALVVASPWDRTEDCGTMRWPSVHPLPIERRYAFYDSNVDQLEALQADLEGLGYHSAEIVEGPIMPSDLRTLFMLQTDQLDLPSFRAREVSLCELAKRHRVESFWAISPTNPAHRPKTRQAP